MGRDRSVYEVQKRGRVTVELTTIRARGEVAAELHDEALQVLAAALVLLDRGDPAAARDAVTLAMEQVSRITFELDPGLARSRPLG